jgi:hypothetical protein
MVQVENGRDRETVSHSQEVSTKTSRMLGWAELLILQLALIVGAAIVLIEQSSPGRWTTAIGEHWELVVIACATLSIGFGAAILLNARLSDRNAAQLEEDYRALASRADSLLQSSTARLHERESKPPPKQ